MPAPAITSLNGAVFSLLRVLFFVGPDAAERQHDFVARSSGRGGARPDAPQLIEHFARDDGGPPERTGWIWIDQTGGKGAFFEGEAPVGIGGVPERFVDKRRPPRRLRRRLAQLLKLSLEAEPDSVDLMAWNIHALNAVRIYDEQDQSRRYAQDLIQLFINIQARGSPIEQCETIYRRVILNTQRYTVPQYLTGRMILALLLLIQAPGDIGRHALATAIRRSYTIDPIPSVTLEHMVDTIVRSVLFQDDGVEIFAATCADMQAQGDAQSKNSIKHPTYSCFANDLYMAAAPYVAALIGWCYLLGEAGAAARHDEIRAAQNYCDERLAKIGTSLTIAHELFYQRRALHRLKSEIMSAFRESRMKGEIALSNATMRDMIAPLYWSSFLKGETDVLTGI